MVARLGNEIDEIMAGSDGYFPQNSTGGGGHTGWIKLSAFLALRFAPLFLRLYRDRTARQRQRGLDLANPAQPAKQGPIAGTR